MKMLTLTAVSVLVVFSFFLSCTKEIPEKENKSGKDKEVISSIFNTIVDSYNKKEIDTILTFYAPGYVNYDSDENGQYGTARIKEDYTNAMDLYPNSFLEIKIEETEISGSLAYVRLTSQLKVNYGKNSPKETLFSKSSFEILKKQEEGSWLIVRSMGFQIFTYD